MADSKIPTGEPDRMHPAAGERYEIQHLAERYGISTAEALELIERFGSDREALEREAARLRSR